MAKRSISIVLLLFFFVGGCVSARTQVLRAGLVSLNAARDTMLSISKAREAQIVEKATTKEEGRAQLEAWRAHVDEAAVAIKAGYDAIWAASILDDAKSESDVAAAVAKALALFKELKKP